MFVSEITEGWNGDKVLEKSEHEKRGDAYAWVKQVAPKHSRWYHDVWTCTSGNDHVIVDFGSHQIFARISHR